MDKITIDIDDLFRLLRLASQSRVKTEGADIGAYSRACQALLSLGFSPDEISNRIHNIQVMERK